MIQSPTVSVAAADKPSHTPASPIHTFPDEEASEPHELLGSWIEPANLAKLAEEYANAQPFPHVVIDSFWKDEFAAEMAKAFLDPRATGDRKGWHCYNNPLEQKLANNDFATFPKPMSRAFSLLQSDAFVQIMRQVTRLDTLESDPYLHGAGMHASCGGGKLDMHLDYSIHPTSGKERRVNIINYLSPEWQMEWGGALQFFGHDDNNAMTKLVTSVAPVFNRVALFRTSDISYHGFPDAIRAPESELRKSLAVYYVSPARPEAAHRYKARYYKRPEDEEHEGLERLREIRVTRWITPADIEEHVPGWTGMKW